MSKKALITGVTGQDGSFLAEFLLEKGYEVYGMIRRSSVDYRERIAHLEGLPKFHLVYGDLADAVSLIKVMTEVKPDEVYNLAAQSHVQVSFDVPEYTADIVATGVLRVLEAIRIAGLEKTCRMYQASTSELYGKVEEVPQNEKTPFHPFSPYAVKPTICSAAPASCLTMSRSAGERPLSPGKSPWQPPASSRASRRN